MIAVTERRRPRVFIATVCCFVFLVSSRNTNHASAKRQQQGLLRVDRSATTTAAASPGDCESLARRNRVSASFRGGSLEESSSGEAGDNESGRDAPEGSEEDGTPVDEDSLSSSSSNRTEIATALRLEGKKHHDEGDFVGAAKVFRKAADTLLTGGGDSSPPGLSEDYATCRLHQALCNLKSGDYELCIEACTEVLRDDGAENHHPSGSARLPAIVNARAYHRRAKAKSDRPTTLILIVPHEQQ